MIQGESRAEGSRSLLPLAWQSRQLLIAVLVATAALNVILVVSKTLNSAPSVVSSPGFTVIVDPNWELMRMKVRIGLALVLAAVALSFGRLRGLAVSFIPTAWVLIEYLIWWYRSYVIAKNAESADFAKVSHLAYLHTATWWDVWIIVLISVVLIYELKTLLKKKANHTYDS
jgi:hypothetical protein